MEAKTVNRYPKVLSLVTERTGLKKRQVDMVLRQFIDLVKEEAMAGRTVSLVGFGAFFARQGGGFIRGGRLARRSVRVCFRSSQSSRKYLEEAVP
jgi:hypothetical protein